MNVEIALDQIRPSPYQPRLTFDLEDIRGSIQSDGILVPLTVRKRNDHYELIDGERRLRLAKDLSYQTISCTIIEVSDEVARRMVYKVNKERKNYTPYEEAVFFRKLVEEEGMKPYQIEKQLRISHHWVMACLNVWKLPKDLQDNILGLAQGPMPYRIYMSDVRSLETEFLRNVDEAIAIIREIIAERMTTDEKLEFIGKYKKKINHAIIDKALEAVEPEAKTPKTAEEFEEASKVLKREAERRKTAEQKAEAKRRKLIAQARTSLNATLKKIDGASKIIDVSDFREQFIKLEKSLDQNPAEVKKQLIALGKEVTNVKKQRQREIEEEKRHKDEEERKRQLEEEIKRVREMERLRLEEEMQRKLEEEKSRLEEDAMANARDELLRDTEFIREFIKKEYPLMPMTMKTEDLEKELMQRLLANIPETKMIRAEEIFREEFNSLQKRLEIFPEKSQKIEPKFDQLRLMKERGVIPYTIWDFPYRDDYAGDKGFHGNCSPQIVEQCIWRLTEEDDLVVDPMAGSGTAIDVCKKYSRKCIGYDVKPPENRPDIIQNDSRNMPLDNESVDMVFIHPPYWNLVHYTKADERLPDLSRAKTSDEFIDMFEQVFRECYRILKPEKFMCVLIGDLIRDGRFVPLCRETTTIAEKIGFLNYGYAVKLAHGEVSRKKSGVIVAEPFYTKNLKISHDLVLFLRKPE